MQSRIVIRIVFWPLYRDFAGDTQHYCSCQCFGALVVVV